ncbi:N-acetylneuraminate lyase [Candidatus Cetobacterium colombiensis]|jgi:N-acetylneuraminate lyase|uniref:N-acetylneuraminate lyase n=1 Tax=Candidatus Cetobacterium colombiensis TaxID=3073100 RepID=A0ABU4WF94_9FUSO|nr:N-acetylneuraminate lyase [Candidatus Cetobacterium colombiensis]MDX8337163.1 N-acetylneuraminate lyase [Candidatus Cetobacterium colombiensis]
MDKLKGIFSALLVAFDKDGNIDEKGIRETVRHNIDNMKVDGLYVGGSTGENFMLTTEDKKRIFDIAMDEAKGQIAMIAQVGALDLREAVELGKYATDLGYDALSAVTPFYYKFTFEEIKNYYNTITNETNNKMIVYSISLLTGVNMSVSQFAELFENKNIIGVKFTEGNFYLMERLRHAFPDKLIYSGFDEMLLSATVLNVDGAIGSTYNINGVNAKKIFTLAKEGKVDEARELQRQANDMIEAILGNGLFQTLKEILKCQGVDAGFCKEPLGKLPPEKVERAKEIYRNYL